MKILKHGKRYVENRQFTCFCCGCEFVATYLEYRKIACDSIDFRLPPKFPYEYVTKCPECGAAVKEGATDLEAGK